MPLNQSLVHFRQKYTTVLPSLANFVVCFSMIVGTCSKLDGLPILKVVSTMVVTKPTPTIFSTSKFKAVVSASKRLTIAVANG